MADGRKIPYIIEMGINDEKLKRQMSQWDWEEIIGIKGFGKHFEKPAKEASDAIENAFANTSIDWEKALQTDAFKSAVTKIVQHANKELREGLLGKDEAKQVAEFVSEIGKAWKEVGVTMGSDGFARSMAAFAKSVEPLVGQIDKLTAAFGIFSDKINSDTAKVAGGFTVIGDAAGRAAVKVNKSIETMEAKLASIDAILSKDYGDNFKFDANLEAQFYGVDEAIEKVEGNIDKLSKKFNKMSSSDKDFETTRRSLVQLYTDQIELYRQLEIIDEEYTKKNSKNDSLLTLNAIDPKAIIGDVRATIETLVGDAKRQLQDISTSTKTTKDGINIPIKLPSQAELVKTINNYVKSINDSDSIHGVRLKLDSGWLNDTANVIEDKTKRAYGDTPADFDKNTSDLVKKTEDRFGQIAGAIKDKQDQIVKQTTTWRQQMLEQFKFKSGDFEFKFNNNLIEELQTLFDEYGLKVNIDPAYLADQIKTVLEGSSVSLGGGTASIDPSAMASAVMAGVRAALVGAPLTVHTPVNSAQERIPDATEQVATEIEQTAKHLDVAEEYVQDVVKKIKDVARYAVKDPGKADTVGAKETREQFGRLGIDLARVKSAGDNDAQIASILEQALLKDGQLGKLMGSTAIDELSNFKGSTSKTIPKFIDSLREVFYMLQEDAETTDEWTRKQKSKEVFDWARGRAKAATALREVRSPIRQEKIPSTEAIDKAITLMTAIGRNTDSLEVLKAAREKLGSQTDDASVKEFKNVASEFYKGSTKVFYDLKQQAEDMFKGTVYMQGSKKGVIKRQDINNYKQLAKIDDGTTLLDIRVSSSMNNVALGEVKSKYGNRPSPREEQRLMRGQRADYLVSPDYEKDILNRELEYDGFKPKGVETTKIDIKKSIEGLKERIAKTENNIPELQKQIVVLDAEAEAKRQEAKNASALLEAVLNNPDSTEEERRSAKYAKIDAQFAFSEVNKERNRLIKQADDTRSSQDSSKNLLKRLELTEQYNTLLSKKEELEGSIIQMDKDGASQKKLQNQKQELDEINTQLTEVISKAEKAGGLYQQGKKKEYSAEDRKIYALEQLALIEDDLITARAQKNVVASRIKKKDSEIAEVDRWGLGAGIGARELGKEKSKLTSEFVDSDYMREISSMFGIKKRLEETQLAYETAMNHYYEAVNRQWDESLSDEDRVVWGQVANKSSEEAYRAEERLAEIRNTLVENADSDIVDKLNTLTNKKNESLKVHMPTEDINDPEMVRDFLRNNKAGQAIASQYQDEEKAIWDEYYESLRNKKQVALEEFKESIQVKDGVLSGIFKTKDENGEWINEIVEVAVRNALKERLVAAKEILEEQQTPIQENIARLEADRETAITYGGVSDKEILSGDIIADQIRKEEKLEELLAKRVAKIQEIVDLEQAGVPDSDQSVKQANKEKEILDKEITRYEMLIRNRKKLVDMRYDESKEPTYTDEEKELHFTNQIIGYNQKIEDSLVKQEELKQRITKASEEEKERLQYSLKQEEDKVVGWRGKVSKFEGKLQNVGTAKSEAAVTSTSETSGGLLGLIKEAVGEVGVGNVDLTKVEEILNKILAILSGNAVVGSTRNSEMDAKLARIRELEAKQQLANEQKKTAETVKQVENAKKETAESTNVADSKAHKNVSKTQVYKDVQKSVDTFRTSELTADKEPLNAIKMALDELSKINDQNSQEYIEWQRKLGSALAAYGKKNGVENGRGYYDKIYAELEKNGVSVDPKLPITNKSGISNALVEKGLVTIKEKEAKAKQSEAKAEEKITEEKKEQEQIRFTRKEKKELNRLKNETKDYNPDATTGLGSEFGGFATENTLRAILEVLNKISTSGVPKSGTKSKTTTPSNTNDPIPDEASEEVDELTAKIDKLKVKFADAMKVGYLGKKDTGLKDFEKQLKKIDKALAEGKSVEKLEQMRQKAIALGDVVNTTIAGNKRKYSGTAEMGAATRQRDNMEARGVLDHADLKAVQDYKQAYNDLMAQHKKFATKGTLYDPNNQKTLQNMAITVKDLGKQLEKSVAEADQLQQLVDNSGMYNGKQMGGVHQLTTEEMGNVEASMKSYLQSLNLGNLEHVKFDHTHQKLTATLRTSNKTVADLEVKYNEATGALYAYQKAERESLTGVPAFLNGFKKKFNSIMQYLTMTMSIHRVLAELRKGIQYVREIDLALTELKKVTDETEETYDRFLETAAKTGARLGSTISAVTEATATFAKLGYSMEQATEMAEAAIVYKNVGDNIASTEDAADSIISTMKGFKLEATEAMSIVDKFNETGNRFAITSKGIGEALRLSASALSEGSNSLDESIALITAANEVVNDPSSVGTALKTLTLRLRGSKTELEEAGLDIENMATTTSQLQAKLLALTGGQVDIMSDANTFKNTTQILREMAAAWEDMTDIQRASALELMGGRLLPLRIEICA